MASFVRSIGRLRFEVPLAVALGLAGGFAAFAAPIDRAVPEVARWLIVAAALVVLPPVAWLAMRPRRARPAAEPALEATPVVEEPEPAIRMRRADRHPDAPVPQPIRASRDLGTPFMAVEDGPADAVEPDDVAETARDETALAAADADAVDPDADAVEVAAETPEAAAPTAVDDAPLDLAVVSPEPVAPVVVEPVAVAPETTAVAEPAPGRDSLAAMMDRLSRGVERRGGVPPRRSAEAIARPVQPALRDALATLNRLAERR